MAGEKVVFRTCPLFMESLAKMAARTPQIVSQYESFVKSKSENPLAPFGGKDIAYSSGGNFIAAVPGIKHAHLLHDASIAYTLSGSNPKVFNLYGIFSHDDSGTGRPPNDKKQKNLAKRFKNQSFD